MGRCEPHGRRPRLTTYRSPLTSLLPATARYDRGEDVDDPNAQKGGGDPFGGGFPRQHFRHGGGQRFHFQGGV